MNPRYDGPPLLRFDGPLDDMAVPLLRQRRRLGEILDGLDDTQWSTASRCEGWTVRDVVAHLVGADQFWALSASSALAGEPTRYLVGFDPVATPAQLVDGTRSQAPAEVLAGYHAGVEALAATLTGLDQARWSLPAETPPGNVPLHALARHALWDGWTHERDILLPLAMVPFEEADELLACLGYVAALGPALLASNGSQRQGTLALDGTDPVTHVVVRAGETVIVDGGAAPADAVQLSGRTVDLIEALTLRAPFPCPIPEGGRWLIGALASAFGAPAPT